MLSELFSILFICFPTVCGTCNSKRVLFGIEEIAESQLTLKRSKGKQAALDPLQLKCAETFNSYGPKTKYVSPI